MTTFAQADARAETDARRRSAWTEYHDATRDLEGREYEKAEAPAWERLQATLRELEAEDALAETPSL